MKIGLIYHELVINGGGPRQVICLARELRRLGHSAQLYCYRYAPDDCFPDLCTGIDIRPVKVVSGASLDGRVGARRQLHRYYIESRKLARLMDPDLDLLNPHERPAHRVAAHYRRLRGHIPIVWMFNDVTTWELRGVNAPRNPLLAWMKGRMFSQEAILMRSMDAVTVLDSRIQGLLRSSYGIEAQVVRTGLDLSRGSGQQATEDIRSRYGIPRERFLALWIGILQPHRRIEDLIRAVALLRDRGCDIHALVVGSPRCDPGYWGLLQEVVRETSCTDRISFVPESVPESQLAAFYNAADVFVFPNDQQTWGLAPLEAMLCGKPAVVSKGSGVHEVLADGSTALLVEARNPDAIADALQRLISDPEFASQLGSSAHSFVRQTFSWSKYAHQMETVFRSVAKSVPVACS